MDTLTTAQRRVLDYIRHEIDFRGNSPTYREIAGKFGYRSPNAAVDHVAALAKKGYLRVRHGRSRGIEIQTSTTNSEEAEDVVTVPLLGRIAAGRAVDAAVVATGQVRVDRALLGRAAAGRLFALRVTGDSMTGRGIFDGDIAVAEADVAPRVGDVVVALIDQESTLKSLAKGLNGVLLKAENPRYPDLVPDTEMVIQGVVRTIIRKVG